MAWGQSSAPANQIVAGVRRRYSQWLVLSWGVAVEGPMTSMVSMTNFCGGGGEHNYPPYHSTCIMGTRLYNYTYFSPHKRGILCNV